MSDDRTPFQVISGFGGEPSAPSQNSGVPGEAPRDASDPVLPGLASLQADADRQAREDEERLKAEQKRSEELSLAERERSIRYQDLMVQERQQALHLAHVNARDQNQAMLVEQQVWALRVQRYQKWAVFLISGGALGGLACVLGEYILNRR